jgi:hypothetical protein
MKGIFDALCIVTFNKKFQIEYMVDRFIACDFTLL